MATQYSIKHILAFSIVAATFLAAFLTLFIWNRTVEKKRVLAGEFLNSHGTWLHAKSGEYWDLSGIDDLAVQELALLEYLDDFKRTRILEIDFRNTNVTDQHVQYLELLPNLSEVNFRNTKVTRKAIEKLIDTYKHGALFVEHDY